MIVNATEIKNNFGKYLKLLDLEDVIVTRNGSPIARITRVDNWHEAGQVHEKAAAYNCDGKRISYEEFLEKYENTEDRCEYIDGEVYLLSSPTITHQKVIGNLFVLLSSWFQGKQCTPYLSPFDVTLKKGEKEMNVVQPDLLVICDPYNKNENDKYAGIPTLVIEVLSQASMRKDLLKKLDLYMQSGIEEYWIVNYFNGEVIIYSFKDSEICGMKTFVKEDNLKSFIFKGLEIPLKGIFTHL